MRATSLAVVMSLVAVTVSAAPGVSGTFGSDRGVVEIVDAYAYPGVSEFGDEPAIILRLSTVPFEKASLANSLDREALLDELAGASPSIELELDPKGEWRGSAYYLGSGNGCGYCSSPSAPGVTLKLEGGVLRGAILVKASDHDDGDGVVADLKLEVPVAAEVKATPLGADGGDPYRAFVACQAAVAKKDVAAFRAACDIAEESLSSAEYHGSLDSFWESGLYGHPALALVDVRVTGGRATDGEALVLLLAKDQDGNKHKASVLMSKAQTGWRYRKAEVDAVYE